VTEYADDAVVLDAVPYRDWHQIVSAITAAHGVVRGVLRGARGGKAPAAAATQLLSRVSLAVWRGPHAEMATFRRIDLVRPSFELAANLERSAAAAVAAELILTFSPPDEPAPRHFRLIDAVAVALLADRPPAGLVAYSELWVLRLGGVLPPLDTCAGCGAPLAGRFRLRRDDTHPVCDTCAQPEEPLLDAVSVSFLRRCLTIPPDEVTSSPPLPAVRWLDRLVREEAHRRLRALEFFRKHGRGA